MNVSVGFKENKAIPIPAGAKEMSIQVTRGQGYLTITYQDPTLYSPYAIFITEQDGLQYVFHVDTMVSSLSFSGESAGNTRLTYSFSNTASVQFTTQKVLSGNQTTTVDIPVRVSTVVLSCVSGAISYAIRVKSGGAVGSLQQGEQTSPLSLSNVRKIEITAGYQGAVVDGIFY